MNLINHTPFPALAFQGIDPDDGAFHVIALRQTLHWDDEARLSFSDSQTPLCTEDEYFGAPNVSALRQESDLCQYKPRCDVIVNGMAHAPATRGRFPVRLRVFGPDMTLPLAPPQGINQLHEGSPDAMRQWREDLAHHTALPEPAKPCLIDKTLIATGERAFVVASWPLRILMTVLRWLSFGLIRLSTWRLTDPAPTKTVPLRAEFAFGGQCRINAADEAAPRVPKAHRLTPEQIAQHPDANAPASERPVAHEVFEPNPIGRGFVRDWFLKATRISRIPAPQIERADAPITVDQFQWGLKGKQTESDIAQLTAGFGIRPKGHPERRKLAGTIDAAFIESPRGLPEDFDFAVWNAAPPDQQTEFLEGHEIIELTNLCPADTPGTRKDPEGNTVLRLHLPAEECQLLIRLQSGELFTQPMPIDTVIIEPERHQLTLVWRAVLNQDEDVAIRQLEINTISRAARIQYRHEVERYKALFDFLPQPPMEAEHG